MALESNGNIIDENTTEANYLKAERLLKAVDCLANDKEKAEIYGKLAKMYKSLGEYKESVRLYELCNSQQQKYEKYIEENDESKKKAESPVDEEVKSGKAKRIVIASIAAVLIVCLAGGFLYFKTKPGKYTKAGLYDKTNHYAKSYKLFEELKDYKDSEERVIEEQYRYALQLRNDEAYDEAISMLRKIDGYKDSGVVLAETEVIKLKNAKVGDDLLFGEAHWHVLEKKEDKVLLGKVKPVQVEGVAYNTVSKNITWEECSLREYLNNDFIEEIFNESMAEKILTTEVTVEDNKKYNTKGGNKTQDKLFLLDAKQAEDYADILSDYLRDWWIINPGSNQNMAQFVSYGKVMSSGYDVSSDNIFIRPAMWVSLEK